MAANKATDPSQTTSAAMKSRWPPANPRNHQHRTNLRGHEGMHP
jgi:hypothetical protein